MTRAQRCCSNPLLVNRNRFIGSMNDLMSPKEHCLHLWKYLANIVFAQAEGFDNCEQIASAIKRLSGYMLPEATVNDFSDRQFPILDKFAEEEFLWAA